MSRAILVLNGGSSSLKFAVFDAGSGLAVLAKGSVSQLGQSPRLKATYADGEESGRPLGSGAITPGQAMEIAAAELEERGLTASIVAVGHRIVHGGSAFVEPVVLDPAVVARLRALEPLAPLHQPHGLDIVERSIALLPKAVQVGAFDTAFHADRPVIDRLYGLPRQLSEEGIVAYGFHGLSYAHIAGALRERFGASAGGRAIVAHLGSGASLCAMSGGRSVATTMGFSALDGLIMSSRCGTLDPGVILHLVGQRGMSIEAVGDLLYKRSGLLGVSGLSADMRTLLESDDPRAGEAIELFAYRAGRSIGSLCAALGGLDTLVFTAGIGENSARIRSLVARSAGWLGVEIDEAANERGEERISTPGSRVAVMTIATDEERAVAEGVLSCIGQRAAMAD